MRLQGKKAIVVGAGQTPGETIGNGRATAILFAREGAQVMCVDKRLQSAQDTVDMIVQEGGNAFAEIGGFRAREEGCAFCFQMFGQWPLQRRIGQALELAEGAPEDAMAAVQSIKRKTRVDKDGSVTFDVELRLWDKPAPLKLTGRHVGLYPDRVEVVGKDGGPIQHALSAMPVDALKAELDAIESAEKAL